MEDPARIRLNRIGTIFGILGISVCSIFPLFVLRPLSLHAEQSASPQYLLKFGTIAPENSYWGDIAMQTARDVEARTGGKVKIRWYFGAVMGDEPEMVEKIRSGDLQGAVFTLLGAGEIAPEIYIFTLPFLFQGYDEADYVLGKMRMTIDKFFLEKGFVNLGLVDIGFVRIFSRTPIEKEEHFEAVNGWSWSGEPLVIDTYRLLGVKNFTPLSISQVLPSLQAGAINTVFGTCYSTVGLQWHTRLGYMSRETISFSPGAILVSRNAFESLPPEFQRIVRESCESPIPRLRELIRRDEERVCARLAKHHLREAAFEPGYLAQLRVKSRAIYYTFVDKYFPRWLLAGTLDLLQQYRVEKASLPPGGTKE